MTAQVSCVLPEQFQRLETGIALYQPETGRILDVNDSFLALYGYSLDRLRRMEIAEYSANTSGLSQAEIVDHIQKAGNGQHRQFQWRVKCSDGTLIWVDTSLSPITLDGRQFVLAEVTDSTEQVHNNRKVRLLTRIIRHNLRNDANVILGYARQVATSNSSDAVDDHLSTIRQKALDLAAISESVDQLEKVVADTETRRTIQRVRTTVEDVADTYRSRYPDATITVEERTELRVHADETFRYAISQAIDNAIVHSEQSHPAVEIRIDESPNTGRTEIRILDDCPQIPAMELDALDESTPFTATSHGSGVGLFVMKWCLESLGGELKIEYNRDRGNSVYFYLPNADK